MKWSSTCHDYVMIQKWKYVYVSYQLELISLLSTGKVVMNNQNHNYCTERLRDLKNVSRVSKIHLFIFIEVSVWAATKIDLYPMLLKVHDPDFSKWGPMLLRISNVLLIHPPFIDVLVQICLFYFGHFACLPRCLFEGADVNACTCLEVLSVYFLYCASSSKRTR